MSTGTGRRRNIKPQRAARPLTATERTIRYRKRRREALEDLIRQLLGQTGGHLPKGVLEGLSDAAARDLRTQLYEAFDRGERAGGWPS